MRTFRITALAAVLALVLAACGGNGDTGGESSPTEAATTESPSEAMSPTEEPTEDDATEAGGDALGTAETEYGTILVDAEGFTLYVFDRDEEGTSNCTDQCAQTWPPVPGEVTAGDGVDDSKLATIERADGSTQATYAGLPLYRYAPDEAPGDTNGQGVGEVWWVIDADGEKVTEAASAASVDDEYDY